MGPEQEVDGDLEHEIAADLFAGRILDWRRRWSDAEELFRALPLEQQQQIEASLTENIEEALDGLVPWMAYRIHPSVRRYMLVQLPLTEFPEPPRLEPRIRRAERMLAASLREVAAVSYADDD